MHLTECEKILNIFISEIWTSCPKISKNMKKK